LSQQVINLVLALIRCEFLVGAVCGFQLGNILTYARMIGMYYRVAHNNQLTGDCEAKQVVAAPLSLMLQDADHSSIFFAVRFGKKLVVVKC